jgi:hypothetical protein
MDVEEDRIMSMFIQGTNGEYYNLSKAYKYEICEEWNKFILYLYFTPDQAQPISVGSKASREEWLRELGVIR